MSTATGLSPTTPSAEPSSRCRHDLIIVDEIGFAPPDRDWITLAVLEACSAGVVAEGRFSATGDGYSEAVVFVEGHSVDTERAWVIEGSAGYGRGLAVALGRRGQWVIEFDRPTRKSKDGAKSDAWTPSEPPARCSAGSREAPERPASP